VVGTDVTNRVTEVLNDGAVTWTAAQLLTWLNEARRAVCIVRPDASMTTGSVQLTASETKQSAPSSTVRIKDITRNLGSNGTTPGRRITLISRQELDEYVPNWHTSAASTTIKHWVYSKDNPLIFYNYPRTHATTAVYVEMVRFTNPTDLTQLGDNIVLNDKYQPALIEWCLYRSFSRSAESAINQAKTDRHLQAFFGLLGAQKDAEGRVVAKAREGSL